MTTPTKAQKTEALQKLQTILSSGDVVYTNLRHVSQSGMERAISVHILRSWDGKPEISDISHLVALAGLFTRHTKHEGLKVRGCGMDMGFHVVYSLSSAVLGDGYALKHRWI